MLRCWNAAAAALLVILASAQVSAEQIEMDWLGIAVVIPDDWGVLYRADLDPNVVSKRDALAYIDEVSADGELAYLLAARPLDDSIAVLKFAAHTDSGRAGADSVDTIQGTMRYMNANARGFKVLSGPVRVQIGETGAGAHARYGFSAAYDGQEYDVICDLWFVPFRGRFLQIGATIDAKQGDRLLPVAAQIVRSVRFE